MPTDIKWQGKWIKDLSDDELREALLTVGNMDNFRFDKSKDPRLNKKNHRLGKIHNGNLPPENPTFTNLIIALNEEFKSRELAYEPQD